jgi:putative Holliday junction resolvase
VKVVALDYGRARTGVAVSDPTGTVARPLGVVEHASERAGLNRLAKMIEKEKPDVVVVGLPLTLRGEHGEQARETDLFVNALRELIGVPVARFDERFTTTLASSGGGEAPEDARAAAHLLESYLSWASDQPG